VIPHLFRRKLGVVSIKAGPSKCYY